MNNRVRDIKTKEREQNSEGLKKHRRYDYFSVKEEYPRYVR